MKKKKVKVVLETYKIISEAVDNSVGFGVNRAFKHGDNPSRDYICECVYNEVMNALSDVIKMN